LINTCLSKLGLLSMLSSGIFRLSTHEIFERSQMKSIIGAGRFRCVCVGSVGSWTGSYSDEANAVAAGTQHCSSGVAECRPLAEQ
jgi:hypothetical protein